MRRIALITIIVLILSFSGLSLAQANENNTTTDYSDVTWAIDRIGANEVWHEVQGDNVTVGVVDTGIDIDHPDLDGSLRNLEDEDSDEYKYYPGGWIEFEHESPPEGGSVVRVEDSIPHESADNPDDDGYSHGTHVSGLLTGEDGSGEYVGVAPNVELMHSLSLTGGTGSEEQIIKGIEWMIEPTDRHGNLLNETYGGDIEDYQPDVVSLSFGSDGYKEEYEEPVQELVDNDIIPVSAIGNVDEGNIATPGAIYESFGIGATDSDDDVPSWSGGDIVEDGRGDTPEEYIKPDFSAPGNLVKSTVMNSEYEIKSGTSVSTPLVAGTVALMLEANSTLEYDDIYQALNKTSDYYDAGESLGEEKNTRYGHGIINTADAVASVSNIEPEEQEQEDDDRLYHDDSDVDDDGDDVYRHTISIIEVIVLMIIVVVLFGLIFYVTDIGQDNRRRGRG